MIHKKPSSAHLPVPMLLVSFITMTCSNLIKRYFRFPQTGIANMPDRIRNHMVATVAELAGTFLFLFFALSICQIANTPSAIPGSLPDVSKLLFISLGFGCSVAVNVWIFYRVSGGMFNPAV
jgi:aquaporin related protein